MKKAPSWRAFWDDLATSRNPIAATDRPMVSPETYALYSTDIIEKLALCKDDIVLDIGCGTALIAVRLAEHVQLVYATDFSPTMMRAARLNSVSRENIRLAACDSIAVPFRDGAFSKIIIYGVAQYLSQHQMQQMLQEAKRLVQPNGLIMLGEVVRARDVRLLRRIRDILVYQGVRGLWLKVSQNLRERWWRIFGRRDSSYVRPDGPPITLHSAEALLQMVQELGLRGWKLSQSEKLPWFHQTFDLLIEKI
jgi:SAM-dependent methyltransferase